MAFNLQKLLRDVSTAHDEIRTADASVQRFVEGKVSGVSFTTVQKAAIRTEADAALRAAKVALDAVIAQLDAN